MERRPLSPLVSALGSAYEDERVDFPDDVAALRAALNAMGYDASPGAIEAAYGAWCTDRYAAGWLDLRDDTEERVRRMVEGAYLVAP